MDQGPKTGFMLLSPACTTELTRLRLIVKVGGAAVTHKSVLESAKLVCVICNPDHQLLYAHDVCARNHQVVNKFPMLMLQSHLLSVSSAGLSKRDDSA